MLNIKKDNLEYSHTDEFLDGASNMVFDIQVPISNNGEKLIFPALYVSFNNEYQFVGMHIHCTETEIDIYDTIINKEEIINHCTQVRVAALLEQIKVIPVEPKQSTEVIRKLSELDQVKSLVAFGYWTEEGSTPLKDALLTAYNTHFEDFGEFVETLEAGHLMIFDFKGQGKQLTCFEQVIDLAIFNEEKECSKWSGL